MAETPGKPEFDPQRTPSADALGGGHPCPPFEFDRQLTPADDFRRDLAAAYRPPEPAPAAVDDRLAALARERLTAPALVRLRRQRLVRRLVAASTIGAAAAAIALLVWHGRPAASPIGSPATYAVHLRSVAPSPLPSRVTILDAFTLARELDAGNPVDSRWDLDGNGTVDRRDIDALALRAVRLESSEKVGT